MLFYTFRHAVLDRIISSILPTSKKNNTIDNFLKKLIDCGQIATQYVDFTNNATMVSPFNPNASMMAIEGITNADGRILGKMGHSERYDENLYKNVEGNYDMKIFESGVKYFS